MVSALADRVINDFAFIINNDYRFALRTKCITFHVLIETIPANPSGCHQVAAGAASSANLTILIIGLVFEAGLMTL